MAGFTLDDRSIYAQKFSSVCSICANLNLNPNNNPPVCKAFPSGIPPEIWIGRNNHRKPFTGDNGILFTPINR